MELDTSIYEGNDHFWETVSLLQNCPFPEPVSEVIMDPIPKRRDTQPQIQFSELGTLEAAEHFMPEGSVCIHNFANPEAPCWGRIYERTQEEILFRQTNLIQALDPKLYPITRKVILTKGVTVFRDFGEDYPVRKQPFTVDVVTSAALNRPPIYRGQWQEKDRRHTRRILSWTLFAARNYDIFITGAWGCGVFRNPIPAMCSLWKEMLTSQSDIPKRVIFAIPDGKLAAFKTHLT